MLIDRYKLIKYRQTLLMQETRELIINVPVLTIAHNTHKIIKITLISLRIHSIFYVTLLYLIKLWFSEGKFLWLLLMQHGLCFFHGLFLFLYVFKYMSFTEFMFTEAQLCIFKTRKYAKLRDSFFLSSFFLNKK